MPKLRVLDLDGSLEQQSELFSGQESEPRWLPGNGWGPRIRLACNFGTFDRFCQWLDDQLGAEGPGITLYGSGDFHHVSLALLKRIPEPFNLLVLDKHPDWMRGIPFLHCGTWLRHALDLRPLRRVFHCGGELDFDNAYRWLAPWPAIESGRIVVFPALRRFRRGRWAGANVHPILGDERGLIDGLNERLDPYRSDLIEVPLYVSIDKDVLVAADAAVNWDSGLLSLAVAVRVIETFFQAAGGRLAGADILGDWSPIRLGHLLNRLCDRLDHPSPRHEAAEAAKKNARANATLLQCILPLHN